LTHCPLRQKHRDTCGKGGAQTAPPFFFPPAFASPSSPLREAQVKNERTSFKNLTYH